MDDVDSFLTALIVLIELMTEFTSIFCCNQVTESQPSHNRTTELQPLQLKWSLRPFYNLYNRCTTVAQPVCNRCATVIQPSHNRCPTDVQPSHDLGQRRGSRRQALAIQIGIKKTLRRSPTSHHPLLARKQRNGIRESQGTTQFLIRSSMNFASLKYPNSSMLALFGNRGLSQ